MNATIRLLVDAGVRFIVIGGHAMRYAGMPRMTLDWDLYIPPHDLENFSRINAALEKDLDMEVVPLGPRGENFVQTFPTQWALIQFHLIVAGVPSYDAAEQRAVEIIDDGVRFKRISGPDLLNAKQKANRPQDQADIRFLQELEKLGKLG
jgi:predicted nucleotidyltransferase